MVPDGFAHELAREAATLEALAVRARRRGLHGLADRLTEAADSSRSWSAALLDDARAGSVTVYLRPRGRGFDLIARRDVSAPRIGCVWREDDGPVLTLDGDHEPHLPDDLHELHELLAERGYELGSGGADMLAGVFSRARA